MSSFASLLTKQDGVDQYPTDFAWFWAPDADRGYLYAPQVKCGD
jgi:hypothetical protein